eukprot:jgi/Tetstr1/440337/TSEL_028673.t1
MVLPGQENFDDYAASEDSFGLGPPPTRRATKVAWNGGTKVDEENFLKMQQDYLRVMAEFNDSEKQRKQLAAKLARAEDAAKRLLVKGDRTAKGGAAARLYEMEGEVQRLTDENIQLKHKLARERKAVEVLRDRNKELDLQVRKALADYQRLLRAQKNPKNVRNSARISGTTVRNISEAEQTHEMGQRFVEQQEELADLKEENEYLRARLADEGVEVGPGAMGADTVHLQRQVADLRAQLAAYQSGMMQMSGTAPMPIPMQTGATGGAHSPQKATAMPGGRWELHELEYEGHVYLVDPRSKIVYSRPSDPNQWPKPLGKLTKGDTVEFRHESRVSLDFYNQLDAYLKGERKKLKEVFAQFDSDNSGGLDRRELEALAKQLAPGVSKMDVKYLVAMLDADGDGQVTYQELMDSVVEIVHAGTAAKDDHSPEALQVMQRIRDVLVSRGREVEDLFHDADVNGDGVLDFTELGRLFRKLIPSLTSQELRFLIAKVFQWDVDGSGSISLTELKNALQVGSWVNASAASHAGSPGRGGSPTRQLRASMGGAQLQSEVNQLHADNMALRQEIGPLRRDLEEARLQAITAEDRWLRADPSSLQRNVGSDISAELKEAWAKTKELRQRWMDAKGALDTMRTDYTSIVNKLDEVHKQLYEERRSRFRCQKDAEFWRMEVAKYRELEPELEKARKRINDLERESNQHFSSIFDAPEEALSELRHLKQELLELRKAKAQSEAREAEARKELARMRGMTDMARPGEIQQLRADNQRLEREASKAQVDLEAVMARLAIYDRTQNINEAATPQSLGSPRDGADGGTGRPTFPADSAAGADVYRELQELREMWHEDKRELDKVRKLLEREEEKALSLQAQVEEMRSYYEEAMREKERRLADTGRIGHRQVERLEERIRKLEAQLRNAYSQGWKKGGVRSSVVGGSVAIDLEEELADLAPDENIFELHLASAALDEDALGKNPPTFLSLDFFEHETQATPVISSSAPEYDHTIQFVVKADAFFVEYLDTKSLVVELNRSKGWDFETVGTARIQLQQCLDDFRLGAAIGRNRQYHYTDVTGPGGRYLGRLRWSASLLKPIDNLIREHRKKQAANAHPPHDRPLDDHPAASAMKRAMENPDAASHLRIMVKGCRGLKPNVPPAECTPYVGFTFPGAQRAHFTPFGRGVHPTFDDEMILSIVRSRELETFLMRAELEFEVFDDADRSTGDSSIIGVATVGLQELVDGLPVEGMVPLYSAQGRQRRGDVEVVIHWHNTMVVAQPPGGADRGVSTYARSRPGTADSQGRTVRVSHDRRPPTGRRTQTAYGPEYTDQSLQKLANKVRPPDDPDELQQVETLSQRSDTREQGDEMVMLPSRHREEERRTVAASLEEASYAGSPRQSDSRSRRSLSRRMNPVETSRRSGGRGSASRFDPASPERPTKPQRYTGQVDASLDVDLPLIRDLSNNVQDDYWAQISKTNIIVHVQSIRLGAEVFHDPRVTSVFVMYELLPEFVDPEDQVTGTVAKTGLQMEFNQATAIGCGHAPELHRRARYALGQMLRQEQDDAYIPFCLVSDKEGSDEDYYEFGFAEVNLHDILAHGDLKNAEVDFVGANSNEIVATGKVTIIAQEALRSILEDDAP